MASINRETIDTFMSITGAPESIALQTLEAYAGNLNEAVNAHFSEGDRNVMSDTPAMVTAPSSDLMDIDDPLELHPRGPSSLLSATRGMNPFSLLDPTFQRGLFDTSDIFDHASELMERGRAPFVSQPREVREIPIEVRDGHDNSARQPGYGPRIEDVTDIVDTEGQELRGSVIIDEEEDDDTPGNLRGNQGVTRPSLPQFDDTIDAENDIEEEMIRAAIEASRKDAEHPNDDGSDHVRITGVSADRPIDVEELSSVGELNPSSSSQQTNEAGSSFFQDEFVELEEQPLVRNRSRHESSSSVEAEREIGETQVSPVVSPSRDTSDSHTQPNGSAFASAEWGGISSEEHDEAVMLEAAMFGGVPETGYHIPYAPHQMMRPAVDTAWSEPRPPSPNLVAQRAIREQQDDEYLASLQADREKALKAMADENAAREAALEEQKRKDAEAQRKLQEEQELERQLAAKQASLPEEPASDDENAINLLVRMPDGSRHGRRFRKSDKLQSLFDFIDVGRMQKPGTYRLVRPYPRRAFSDGENSISLSELGLTSKQEALFLELI